MNAKVNKTKPTEQISYGIEMRIAILIQTILSGKNDWKKLEDLTGIKSVKWRHFNSGVIKPSMEMLETLCREFPQYAFWLTTGLTDYNAGHIAPQINVAFPGGIKGKVEILPNDHLATIAFFKQSLKSLDICWDSFRNTWFDDLGAQDWTSAAEVFKKSVNASIQLRAHEITHALGAKEQKNLLTQLITHRDAHIDEMIGRMRQSPEVDETIDRQRKFEMELLSDLDKEDREE
ncbi:hypothetical protein [Alcaligenes faecalis]|uniref:hypothetical protein n=1 Tax=Alcaligenes faecalis TaxID=511 RepID=UPI0011778B54|nr:hypothetical protein [Alcaligenes faecalis]